MDSVILRTSPDNKNVSNAVSEALSTEVNSVSKIIKGELNHVYKVATTDGNLVIRVFRHIHWPEDGKLEWIEKQLTAYNIPHARTTYYSRENTYFPNGFMVSEFVEGTNGKDAICDGEITFDALHEKLAELLYQIHKIPVKNFGLICGGNGQYNSLEEVKLKKVTKSLEKVKDVAELDNSVVEFITNKIKLTLLKYKDRFKPQLVHGDATPDNTIYTKDGQIILIDWDGALADTWIRDYAWITYFGSHFSSEGSLEERQERIKKSFAKSYPQSDFNEDELKEMEILFHIMQAIDLLPYYYFDQKNMESFDITRLRLQALLNFFNY